MVIAITFNLYPQGKRCFKYFEEFVEHCGNLICAILTTNSRRFPILLQGPIFSSMALFLVGEVWSRQGSLMFRLTY